MVGNDKTVPMQSFKPSKGAKTPSSADYKKYGKNLARARNQGYKGGGK